MPPGRDRLGCWPLIFDSSDPENAFADADYVQRLIDAGVIDAELAIDDLMVDFTRPRAVFAFAPESFPRTTLGGKETGP